MKQWIVLLAFWLMGLVATAAQVTEYEEIEQWFVANPYKTEALFAGELTVAECPPFWDFSKSAQYAQEYAYLNYINKRQNKGWTEAEMYAKAIWNVMKGELHFVLDMVGMMPIVGEPADFINGAWYTYEGNYTEATLCYAGMVPIVGWAATSGKLLAKVIKASDGTISMLKLGKNADGLFTFGNPNELGKILKTSGTTLQAHHIVPWKLYDNPVVQKAAEVGFHLNDELNGIVLQKYSKVLADGVHANHPAYSGFVQKQIDAFSEKCNYEIDSEKARYYLENELIPLLRKHIQKAESTGMSLNQYFKLL